MPGFAAVLAPALAAPAAVAPVTTDAQAEPADPPRAQSMPEKPAPGARLSAVGTAIAEMTRTLQAQAAARDAPADAPADAPVTPAAQTAAQTAALARDD